MVPMQITIGIVRAKVVTMLPSDRRTKDLRRLLIPGIRSMIKCPRSVAIRFVCGCKKGGRRACGRRVRTRRNNSPPRKSNAQRGAAAWPVVNIQRTFVKSRDFLRDWNAEAQSTCGTRQAVLRLAEGQHCGFALLCSHPGAFIPD